MREGSGMTSVNQISFDDIGRDPSHQHIVQGFGSDPRGEIPVSFHPTLESARSQLAYYLQDLEYNHGVEGTKVSEDRFEFGLEEDVDGEPFEEIEPGWIRVFACDLLPCYKAHKEEIEEDAR